MAQIFHTLISVDEATRKASEAIRPVAETEKVKIGDSLNRVLSHTVRSPVDSPPYDRSIVDGYAVRFSDVEEADESHPVKLKVSGSVAMGHGSVKLPGKGHCMRIPTGGYVPEGCDAVVMVEHTSSEGEEVYIYRSAGPGENIARAGSDIPMGEVILRAGSLIGPTEIAVLSSLGLESVEAYRRLSVGILSTGDELISQGGRLKPGKLYESNSHSVKAVLDSFGIFDSHFIGIIPDSEEKIRSAMNEAARDFDVVVASGSTSAGEGDMVYRILGEFEPGVQFHGLQIKPGMPSLMAMKGKKVIIGLPGFPVSAIMVFRTVFLPALLKASHYRRKLPGIEASLPVNLNLDIGKLNLIPVSVVGEGEHVAYPVIGGSGSISRILKADGYLSLKGDRKFAEKGERVSVTLFGDHLEIPDIVFAGTYDPVLEEIFPEDMRVKIISTSTRQALEAISRGEADMAALNIFDRASGTYNSLSNYPEILGSSFLVKGFRRETGIITAKGNPLKIMKISHIADKRARFVNLEKSSGARPYIDFIFATEKVEKDRIVNYDYEVGSVNAVASTIRAGKADAGIGTKIAADLHGLNFIPLSYDEYDFVVRKESREKASGFLENLRSRRVRELINSPGSGYRI